MPVDSFLVNFNLEIVKQKQKILYYQDSAKTWQYRRWVEGKQYERGDS